MDLLDHGYIRVIETYGSDERIIEAARMSTAKGFLGWGPLGVHCQHTGCDFRTDDAGFSGPCPQCGDTGLFATQGDEKLLRYLWKNNHTTPFEMAGAIIEVQAPIFVFREWHRHRTQSYNELSARYTPLPDLNYVPSVERLLLNAGGSNRQAGTIAGSKIITAEDAERFRKRLEANYAYQQELYEYALTSGVSKELARVHLPVGRYSRMRAHANLRNWLAFLTLRQASNAQWEIRQYANALCDLLASRFPRTLALFNGGG